MLFLILATLGTASAQDSLLETWRTRTGLVLQQSEGVQIQPAAGGMAMVGRGVSLLLSPATAAEPLQAALKAQYAPFTQAGGTASPARAVSCSLGGAPATCLTVTVEVTPGASMRLLAAHRAGSDWTAVCLQRNRADATLCDAVIRIDAGL